jgi:hypothetical protein
MKVRSATVHMWKPAAETEPTDAPDSPPPLFSVPLALTDLHEMMLPVAVSLTIARPDRAVIAPPGRMVHVAVAGAGAVMVTPRAAARIPAQPANGMWV